MPLEWLVMMCAARHQIRNGKWLLCITVPAVTDVCRAQPAHSQVARLRFNGQPLQVPQDGHTKPSGQRCSAGECEHASSSENLASNAGAGHSVCRFFIWLAWVEQYQNTLDWQAASHYIKCRRSKGDKPLQQEFFNSIGRSLRSCIKGGIQRIAR